MTQLLLFEVQNSADADVCAKAQPRADVSTVVRAEHGPELRADGMQKNGTDSFSDPFADADAELRAEAMQPQRGDLSIDGAAHTFPVASAERPVEMPGTGRSAGATRIGGCWLAINWSLLRS